MLDCASTEPRFGTHLKHGSMLLPSCCCFHADVCLRSRDVVTGTHWYNKRISFPRCGQLTASLPVFMTQERAEQKGDGGVDGAVRQHPSERRALFCRLLVSQPGGAHLQQGKRRALLLTPPSCYYYITLSCWQQLTYYKTGSFHLFGTKLRCYLMPCRHIELSAAWKSSPTTMQEPWHSPMSSSTVPYRPAMQ